MLSEKKYTVLSDETILEIYKFARDGYVITGLIHEPDLENLPNICTKVKYERLLRKETAGEWINRVMPFKNKQLK